MTSQNQTGTGAERLTTPHDDSVPKAPKPSEVKRELHDDELAAVAGDLNPQPLPPRRFPAT
jgi:hypothetical protein